MDSLFDLPGHQAHRRIPEMKSQGGALLLTVIFRHERGAARYCLRGKILSPNVLSVAKPNAGIGSCRQRFKRALRPSRRGRHVFAGTGLPPDFSLIAA